MVGEINNGARGGIKLFIREQLEFQSGEHDFLLYMFYL